jgi:hypothetical protein|tara:strand:- start:1235 stop:2176 length:942 start_codon:yes stop_codon:yes gene_type:complete
MRLWIPILIGGLLLAGALAGKWYRRRSSRGPQMVAWITPSGIKSAYAAGNALQTLPLYSATSVKITDGQKGSGYRDKKNGAQTNGGWIDDYMAEAKAAGVPVSGHGFHYLLTPESSAVEGARAAEAALFHKVKAYSCNCEIQWLKGSMNYKGKSYRSAGALSATAMAFNEAFRSVAPNIRLNITPMMNVKNVWGPLMTPQWLAQWDGLERMVFATSPKTRMVRWTDTLDLVRRVQKIKPSFAYVPLWATGSIESSMSYAGAQLQTLTLEQSEPTEFLGVYYGNYAGTMWNTGNNYGPSWAKLIPALQGKAKLA